MAEPDEFPDDRPDGASPWLRDDWMPDSAAPDADVFAATGRPGAGDARGSRSAPVVEPTEEEFDAAGDGRSTRSSIGRQVVAAGVVLALLVGSAGALVRSGDDEPEMVPDSTAPTAAFPETPPAEPTAPPSTAPRIPATTPTPVSPEPAVLVDPPPPVVVGEVPVWAERTIAVPEPLASIAPTEVVTLSQAGVVSVTEFPSGRSRSIDASSPSGEAQLAFGDGTIVVFDSTTLLQVRDGEPVVETELRDGIIFVQPWTGTGTFVVTTPNTGPSAPEQDWVLRPDGSLELLDNRFTAETSFFSRVFSPSGDALFNGSGGVYAVDPDGLAQRISTGTLLATGTRHWAIEECDETLRCAYSIIEWESGTVTPGVLDRIDVFGLLDPSTRISPDGRSIVHRSDTDGSNRRQILDVATGDSVQAGRINQITFPESWASDSSGVFIADDIAQFVERTSGTVTRLEDLGRVRTVATGPFASPPAGPLGDQPSN